jgi:menaquinone-dependent protoporphyrinogen IX oxidase
MDMIRFLVRSLIRASPEKALEIVDEETPASFAISFEVMRLFIPAS